MEADLGTAIFGIAVVATVIFALAAALGTAAGLALSVPALLITWTILRLKRRRPRHGAGCGRSGPPTGRRNRWPSEELSGKPSSE